MTPNPPIPFRPHRLFGGDPFMAQFNRLLDDVPRGEASQMTGAGGTGQETNDGDAPPERGDKDGTGRVSEPDVGSQTEPGTGEREPGGGTGASGAGDETDPREAGPGDGVSPG